MQRVPHHRANKWQLQTQTQASQSPGCTKSPSLIQGCRESEDRDPDLVLPPGIPLPPAQGSSPGQEQGGDAQHGQQGVLRGEASLREAQVRQRSQQPRSARP